MAAVGCTANAATRSGSIPGDLEAALALTSILTSI
jgi:hypothetical protein